MKIVRYLIREDLGFKTYAKVIDKHGGVKFESYETGEITIHDKAFIVWSCYDPDGDLIGQEFADGRFDTFELAEKYLKTDHAKLFAIEILMFLVKKENKEMISSLLN